MRDIKFKFWDAEKKVMSIERTLPELFDAVCQFEYDTRSEQSKLFKRLIYLEFTGLNDKSGKEIYTGDILVQQEGKLLGAVDFEHGCFVLKAVWIDHEQNDYPELKYYCDMSFMTVEVIGNVFQHPNLLEVQQ